MKRNNFSGPIMALITMGFVIYIWKKIVDALFDGKVYVAEPSDEENQATDDDESIANATENDTPDEGEKTVQ